MKKSKILSIFLTLVLVFAMMAAAGIAEDASGNEETLTVRVGCILPYSGAATNNSDAAQMAIDAYIKYFNENMGGFDRNIEIEWVYGDSESTSDGAVSAFERLVNNENVDVIIGTGRSVETGPCVPLAIKYEVPFILLHTVADTLVNTPNDYVFRPTPGDAQEKIDHRLLWDVLDEAQGGIENMVIIYSAEDFGSGAADYYREIAAEKGVEILLDESVQIGVADLSGVINKIRNLQPDLIFTALQINEALLFQKTLQEYRIDIPVLTKGAGYVDISFIGASNGTAEGVVSSAFWCVDSLQYLGEEAQRVGNEMMQAAGIEMNEVSVSAWVTTACLLDSINRAETLDREGIAAALKTLYFDADHPANMFAGYESVSFGENPDVPQYNQNQNAHVQFCQIQNGEWVTVYPESIFGENENPLIWPYVTE